MSIYNTVSLTPCEHCGRTFSDTAWKNHRKICTAERPMKSAPKPVDNPTDATLSGKAASAHGGPLMPGSQGSQSFQPPSIGQDGPGQAQSLEKCESCGRSFNASALERHMKVCNKVFGSKRKPMDSKKQRLKGVIP